MKQSAPTEKRRSRQPRDVEIDYDAFRDHISTVNQEGKRNWIYPRKPKGRYHRRRVAVAAFLLLLLFSGPLLRWNGQPMFLFNIFERKFILFGFTFWPQDFYIFVLFMITGIVFIVLFTVAFGRLWCGWACPQTIFMEMVFRKIEYWIEGDRAQQIRLDKSPWNATKIRKKVTKWAIFYLISLLIAHTLMAYLVGTDELAKMVTHPPAENWGKFVGLMAFSGIFYFVFAWFREQACIVVCPYGRLQGAMLGKDSIVVIYDWVRGEPRERVKKGVKRTGGDCIACGLCEQVCPTGIDIKNGTQMECVNCTACIDACDEVMEKVGFPKGLIRYDSYNNVAEGKGFRFTPRMVGYTTVLAVLLGLLTFFLTTRTTIDTILLHTPGTLYQKTEQGEIVNLFNVKVINKSLKTYPLEFKLTSHPGEVRVVGNALTLEPQSLVKGSLFIQIPAQALESHKTPIKVEVWSGDQLLDEVKTNFLGPFK
ncbi:MAG: cytochrome c oxidase accessory protein CcoG [Bacteroidetes bacterium]|nr:MAG: cytochrome c oxidase accessory protein CcoG [Bacteroidota bacterium]